MHSSDSAVALTIRKSATKKSPCVHIQLALHPTSCIGKSLISTACTYALISWISKSLYTVFFVEPCSITKRSQVVKGKHGQEDIESYVGPHTLHVRKVSSLHRDY